VDGATDGFLDLCCELLGVPGDFCPRCDARTPQGGDSGVVKHHHFDLPPEVLVSMEPDPDERGFWVWDLDR
jgi:hypothetical protein